MVHHMCALRTMGMADRFWPLINNKFAVFLGQADTIFIYCKERIVDSAHFVGLKVVTVPENCRAQGRSFQFRAGSRVVEEDALLKLAPVTLEVGDFQGHFSNSSEVAQLLANTARDVHIPTRLPIPVSVSPVSYYGLWLGAGSVGLVCLTILVLFVKWKRQPVLSPPAV